MVYDLKDEIVQPVLILNAIHSNYFTASEWILCNNYYIIENFLVNHDLLLECTVSRNIVRN